MTQWLLLLLAVVLTLGTAVFVAVEFSLVALDRPTVQRAVDQGDHRAESVLVSLRALSTQLSAAQVGITLTTLILGFIASPSLGALLEPVLGSAGVQPASVAGLAAGIALVIATVFSMIVGELNYRFTGPGSVFDSIAAGTSDPIDAALTGTIKVRGDMRFLMRQAEMVQVLLKAYSQGVDTTWPKGRPPYDGVG